MVIVNSSVVLDCIYTLKDMPLMYANKKDSKIETPFNII